MRRVGVGGGKVQIRTYYDLRGGEVVISDAGEVLTVREVKAQGDAV